MAHPISLWLSALAAFMLLSGCGVLRGPSASVGQVAPDLNKLPSGLLIEEGARDLLPPDVKIRAVHPDGLALTKVSEGWVPTLYNDAAGYCTIGYGHLIKKARCDGTELADFRPRITFQRGTDLLVKDMSGAQISVMTAVKINLNDKQYSALTDFVFNVGGGKFRSSTLLQKINANRIDEVPFQLRRWTKAGGKPFPGLVTRREAEIRLFFDGAKDTPSTDKPKEAEMIDVQTGEGQ